MTTIETMRKALEALEQPNAGLVPHDGEWRSRQSLAIDALRADIARLEAAEPVALGAPIAPEHDAELAAHAERAEQLHAEFLLAQKTYAYNTPGIARCARMSATPEGRRSLDAGRVSIGLEPIWEPAFAATPPAAISWDAAMPTEVAQWLSAHPPTFIKPVAPPAAIPALTREEFEDQVPKTFYSIDERGAFKTGARWAYALAAERACVEIKEEGK